MKAKEIPDEIWWWRYVTEPLDVIPGEFQNTRERIYQLGLENHPVVKEADEDFILFLDEMKERAQRWEVSFIDDPSQPLEKWWWHPNKILKGELPPEKLPPHLRKIYEEEWFTAKTK